MPGVSGDLHHPVDVASIVDASVSVAIAVSVAVAIAVSIAVSVAIAITVSVSVPLVPLVGPVASASRFGVLRWKVGFGGVHAFVFGGHVVVVRDVVGLAGADVVRIARVGLTGEQSQATTEQDPLG